MRFDKRCTLILKGDNQPRYDPELGKMIGGSRIEKLVPANVGPVSAKTVNLLGDKLKEASLVVRIRHCKGEVERLLIDGRLFAIVDNPRHSNGMTVFYVSEVKNGNLRD